MTSRTLQIEELPYRPDGSDWFEALRGLPGALWFDSGYPHCVSGRFDIMMADPLEENIFYLDKSTDYDDVLNYFEQLRRSLGRAGDALEGMACPLPFCGGLAGCLDYELGKPLHYLPAGSGLAARVNLYGWALVQDHRRQRCALATLPLLPDTRRRAVLDRLRNPPAPVTGANFALLSPFDVDLDLPRYRDAFARIQAYILDGDCYQINLARRFTAGYEGDPWQAYRRLRPLAAAPFGAFMDSGDRQLLCLSPERFLELSHRRVETRPIKGTAARHADPEADRFAADALIRSPKDRAENLMIVDLLRNDIGRNCVPGSVRADRMFELESYPAVHHLVSTVTGELKDGADGLDLLRDCFPGGSITGAPKRRAMEVIDELESGPRRAYCGTLFYVSADGRLDSNITIRTLQCEAGQIHCWGGGGVVADSNADCEFQETRDKIGRFIDALEAPG